MLYPGRSISGRIVNGVEVTTCDRYHFQANLLSVGGTRSWCGGVVLGPNLIGTAAHCIGGGDIEVAVGNLTMNPGADQECRVERRRVAHQFVHPGYNGSTMINDVAILVLGETVSYPGIQLASPATFDYDTLMQDLLITGFGTLSSGGFQPDNLQVAALQNRSCAPYNNTADQDSVMVCGQGRNASNGGVIDACQGDSGGPMVKEVNGQFINVGFTSWGYGCAMEAYPGVWARAWSESAVGGNMSISGFFAQFCVGHQAGSECVAGQQVERSVDGESFIVHVPDFDNGGSDPGPSPTPAPTVPTPSPTVPTVPSGWNLSEEGCLYNSSNAELDRGNVPMPTSYEFPATCSVDASNTSMTASIDRNAQRHWVVAKMAIEPSTRFTLTWRRIASNLGNLDPLLTIRDSEGNFVAYNDDASGIGLDSRITFDSSVLPAGSSHVYVILGGYSSWTSGAARLQVDGYPDIMEPTDPPTAAPTDPPTAAPTEPPTAAPTMPPTESPTEPPTDAPTEPPTDAPTESPTEPPTDPPTDAPTMPPTEPPTAAPIDRHLVFHTDHAGLFRAESLCRVTAMAELDAGGSCRIQCERAEDQNECHSHNRGDSALCRWSEDSSGATAGFCSPSN